MSTLPVIPPIFRNLGLGKTQDYSAQQFVPAAVQKDGAQSEAATMIAKPAPPQAHNLTSIRDESLQKYDLYLTQLRRMDRDFNLQVRRIEQGNFRAFSKSNGNLNSLYSEAMQLKGQSASVSQKLKAIRQNQKSLSSVPAIPTLNNSFDKFDREFGKSLIDLASIFENHSINVSNVIDKYSSLREFEADLLSLPSQISDLSTIVKKNEESLDAVKVDIGASILLMRTESLTKLQERANSLSNRVGILEKKAADAAKQSQSIYSDSQTFRFEMGKKFEEELKKAFKGIKETTEKAKAALKEMEDAKLMKIQSMRKSIEDCEETIQQAKNLKTISGGAQRTSFMPEIARLKEECARLESHVCGKGTKVYYRVDENGKVRLVFVIDDSIVVG